MACGGHRFLVANATDTDPQEKANCPLSSVALHRDLGGGL